MPKALIFIFIFGFCTANLLCGPLPEPGKKKLVQLSLAYRSPLSRQKIINSGHGLCAEIGLNAGYFLPKKNVIALYAGWGMMDRLWSTSFTPEFTNDYRSSINADQNFSPGERTIINTSSELFTAKRGRSPVMPGCEMNSFHSYSLYYGIFIKLNRSYFPAVKLYTGSSRIHHQAAGDLISDGQDYAIFQIRRAMHGCELLFTSLFKNKHNYLDHLGLSIYYEYYSFGAASLFFDDGNTTSLMRFSKFTASSFSRKYNHDMTVGMKVSFNLL